MLILNPEHLETTSQPLPKPRLSPKFAAATRVALAVGTAVAAGVSGYGITQHLNDAWPLWVAVAAAGGFVYLASLTAIVVEGVRWHVPVAVIWGASFALALPWRGGIEAFAIGGIVAAAAVVAYISYGIAVRSYETLHTFTVLRKYTSVLASGVVVALIVLYGAAVSRGSALLPQGILANAADSAARFVPTFVPSLAPASGTTAISVQDLVTASVRSQLENDPRYKVLSPSEQAKALSAGVAQATASFTKQLGVANASPSSSVGTIAQGAVSSILERFHDRYGIYFTIAWLLGAFFIARSAAFLVTLIIAGLAWATVSAAVALGVLQIETVPSSRERIIL